MGRQIIRCPGGGWNVFSTNVDDWLFEEPCTKEQLVNWFREQERLEAERRLKETKDLVDRIEKGEKCYFQFTMTYAEAARKSKATRRRERSHAEKQG